MEAWAPARASKKSEERNSFLVGPRKRVNECHGGVTPIGTDFLVLVGPRIENGIRA
jgi:hypothetical protein